MQNIRVSLDLLKLQGARVVRFPNSENVKTTYLCIPVEHCFIPRDSQTPYVMATMIHCPNAKYGDFMLKPYVSGEDYKMMSDNERRAIPVIGKGTFIVEKNDKQLNAAADEVVPEPADFSNPTAPEPNQPANQPQPAPTNGPAAPCSPAPSPAVGGPQDGTIQLAEFWLYSNQGWLTGYGTFQEAACAASGREYECHTIVKIVNNAEVDRWNWNETQISWVQAPKPRRK